MKQIPVSFGEFALIDDEDYSEVSKYSWTTQKRATKTNKVAVRAFKKGEAEYGASESDRESASTHPPGDECQHSYPVSQ